MRYFESIFQPFPPAAPAFPSASLGSFLWESTQGARLLLGAVTVLAGVVAAIEAVLFSLVGRLVDTLAVLSPDALWAQERVNLLTLTAVLLISIPVVALQAWLKYQLFSVNFPTRMRWHLHRLMLDRDLSFYHDAFAGTLSAKVTQTANAARDILLTMADIIVFGIIYFVATLFLLGSFDVWLLLPFLSWLALYIAALAIFVPRLARSATTQAAGLSTMAGCLADTYANIAAVKTFSNTRRESAYAMTSMRAHREAASGQLQLIARFETVEHALSVVLIIGTVGAALAAWQHGNLAVGAVAAAAAMALRLNGISQWFMWEIAQLFEHFGTVRDGLDTLSAAEPIRPQEGTKELDIKFGRIAFQNVSFEYESGRQTIPSLSLDVAPGERIGIVGRSGAGKSTVFGLLLGFHHPSSGCIQIDGQDIADISRESLRRHIGIVTQDVSLLHRSVRDNVAYGRPEAQDEEVKAALQHADAYGFVSRLIDSNGRHGLDAHVGERGAKLSGGQRQRLAIARAVLKDAPILLLDEATSALDSEAETSIQRSLANLMQGKTVLAIAHRLSTIAAMDRLLVIDEGQIVEQGTHEQLLAAGGLYARLWAHQSGGLFAGAASAT